MQRRQRNRITSSDVEYARGLARRRTAMDRLNRSLRDLLQERARAAATIARWKVEHGHAVADPARETAMLAAMLRDAPEGFDRATLARLLRAIFRAARLNAEQTASHTAETRGHPTKSDPTRARIVAVVRRIPRGRVATYGQVARVAGLPRNARLVGYTLHALPHDSDVPWHRVVAAGGRIALPSHDALDGLQRALLEAEGITFRGARIALDRHAWRV